MLHSIKDMEHYSIGATDGVVGKVQDFYFDDEAWVIRYLVVETDSWLSHRKVLISPFAIGQPDWSEKIFPVSITQTQVRNSPDIDTDKPVSRQHEMGYLGYYGYPNYWGGGGLWGAGLYPDILQAGLGDDGSNAEHRSARSAKAGAGTRSLAVRDLHDNPHLQSANAVMRYYVHATDGDIGHVDGLLVEEKTWAIRYIIVNTSNWWLGHKVLIAPEWIDDVFWAESTLKVDLTRDAVKASPLYDSAIPLNRELETGIYEHYGRAGYWPQRAKHEGAASRL
jgi:hypothetical protein